MFIAAIGVVMWNLWDFDVMIYTSWYDFDVSINIYFFFLENSSCYDFVLCLFMFFLIDCFILYATIPKPRRITNFLK